MRSMWVGRVVDVREVRRVCIFVPMRGGLGLVLIRMWKRGIIVCMSPFLVKIVLIIKGKNQNK